VGNATLDDNIAEGAQVALWSALGDDHHRIRVHVEDGCVTLAGALDDKAACEAAELAVRAVPGVRRVVPRLAAGSVSAAVAPEVMLSVTRFCGLEPASIRAAVAEGRGALDAFFARYRLPPAHDLVLVFRNRRNDTVTIDIAYPVPAVSATRTDDEVEARAVPTGPTLSALPEPGVAGLLRAASALSPHGDGGAPTAWFWQRIAGGARHPWDASAALPVNVPAAPPAGPAKET
jgi:hypothetical protein